jgi:hypothetical protein
MAIASGVWTLSTDARLNRAVGAAPAYLTPEQAARFERIRQARLLYRGQHDQYFLREGRTQFDFPRVNANGREVTLYVPYNVLKLISHKSADLLFGAEPVIRVEDNVQDAALRDFADRSHLHATLLETEIETSFTGEAIIAVSRQADGQVYAEQVPAERIHPLGTLGPDRQYAQYVRYAETNVGTEQSPIILLLETTYRPGEIERHLWQLDNGVRKNEVDLDKWPPFTGGAPLPIERTGIALNTIVWVPNLLMAGEPISDYDGLIPLQDELNAKQTQIARVLAKHADPKLRVPPGAADDRGNFPTNHDVVFSENKDDYGYLVWDAQLAAALDDRKFTREALCTAAEMSSVLLGLKEGAAPDAARKLRLEATNSLSKAARKATLRRPVIKRLLAVVQMLEHTVPGTRYDQGNVAVEVRDGLPVDELDEAQIVQMYRAAGAMSVERAVQRQLTDPAAVAKEMTTLAAERADAAPSILLNEAGIDDTNNTVSDASTEAA